MEQNKTPEKIIEVDIGNLPKRVQGNDYEDDQRTQEKNGCTEQELTSFKQSKKKIKKSKQR